ncbi:site-2 protease family protein [Thermodesulfobacteriota bacterium]
MSLDTLLRVLVWAVPVLFSIIVHEVSHGWVAHRLGDDTAKRMGRLTLNPIPHLDPVGTVILPLILIIAGGPVFGWAKPVPFNPYNFNRNVNPKSGAMWVALAGPCSNLIIAFISSFLLVATLKYFAGLPDILFFSITQFAKALFIINLFLAALNLIPIPPLDGSKVLMRFLPDRYAPYFLQLERYGFIILILLLATGALSNLITVPVQFLTYIFLAIPKFLFTMI